VLGGSTAAGWPYPNNLMFSRILNIKLSNLFPDKRIEIINTSISAINTYTQLDFLSEIVEQKPDAVLMYSGHNEYYGAFGVASTQTIGNARWLKKLYLNLVQYKTFQLLRDFISFAGGIFGGDKSTDTQTGETLMESLVADQKIEYGSGLYNKGIEQYRENLSEIIEVLADENIPLIISHLVSNIKDQPPFISGEGENQAKSLFNKAKQLESELHFDSAKTLYIKAKDYDLLRFRAPEEINKIIDETAAHYNIPVVQMDQYFEKASFSGIIGNDLILDHLHPNVTGYFLMAEAFYDKLKEEKLVADAWPENSDWSGKQLLADWGMSNLDIVFANLRLAYLKGGWPFKPAGTENTAIKDFKFKDGSERIALRVWKDPDYTSEDAHADYAAYLESNNQFESALREYKALICLKPYNYSAYLSAARVLIALNRKDEALPFLQYSLKLKKTSYAYQWIGITLYEQGKYEKAVEYMAEVYKLDIKEPVLLYCLGAAYAELDKPEMAELMAKELQPLAAKNKSVTRMYLQLREKIKSKNK
jgi:tetratricopeptide (TPR) repeat protein